MRRPWGGAPLRSSTDARLTPSRQSDRLARPASGFPSAEGARGLMTAILSDDIPHCRALVSVQYSLPSALDLLELVELQGTTVLYTVLVLNLRHSLLLLLHHWLCFCSLRASAEV
jgi:hypothetical protein